MTLAALSLRLGSFAQVEIVPGHLPESIPGSSFRKPQFIRGDANGDGTVNISDAVVTLISLFFGTPLQCQASGDVNADGVVELGDPIGVLEFLFLGGRPIPSPGPFSCGVDPSEEWLPCDAADLCPDDLPLIAHVLKRITFGPTEELYSRLQTRTDLIRYIEEQLDAPDDYDQAVLEPSIHSQVQALDIGFRGWDTATLQSERLKGMLLVDAVESEWQLLHMMTQFWNNHFHTQIDTLKRNFFARSRRGGAAVTSNELMFESADANGNEVLSEAEWQEFRELHPAVIPFRIFGERNIEDGELTLEEFLSRTKIGYWKYARAQEQTAVAAELERREYDLYRKLAFGSFRELLEACAKSAAMIIYLNTFENTVEAPNENYAREFFELQSLGVDHVYTQRDIEELSKVFTGWTVGRVERSRFDPTDINFQNNPGAASFDITAREDGPFGLPSGENWDDELFSWGFVFSQPGSHSWGLKSLFLPIYGGVDSLGRPISSDGSVLIAQNSSDHSVDAAMGEFELVLDRVVNLRDCAKFISTKLIQFFVTDDLNQLAKTYPMPADLQASFDGVDLNGDGFLDRAEWGEPVPLVSPNGRPQEIFISLDTDGDKRISELEYQEPDILLDAIDTWRRTDGDIREVVRTILMADEFLSLKFYNAKVKTPLHLVTSTTRVLDGDFSEEQLLRLADDLVLAGMQLFNFEDPTGESVLGFDLMDTGALLERLKFIHRGVNPLQETDRRFNWNPFLLDDRWGLGEAERTVDFLSLLIHNGDLLDNHRGLALQTHAEASQSTSTRETAALLLSLPQFQKH